MCSHNYKNLVEKHTQVKLVQAFRQQDTWPTLLASWRQQPGSCLLEGQYRRIEVKNISLSTVINTRSPTRPEKKKRFAQDL